MCIAMLTSCQSETDISAGQAVLELQLTRAGRQVPVATRAVDNDLCVDIFDDEGDLIKHYAPGQVPAKIVLVPGAFRLRAYTDNQDSWQTANSGRGEACYYAETTFEMQDDMVFRLKLDVPATNYAVALKLPEHFHDLFTAYTFTLASGSRTFAITDTQKAFFTTDDGGFSYAMRATNADGITHAHSAIDFPDVETGKCFTVKYSYATSANTGGVDIIITDDMETGDTNISL
jgi:hypothetical protein